MVTVDDRESARFVDLLAALGVPARHLHLESGDFAFTGHGPGRASVAVGVERKGIPDLVHRIVSGMAAKQLQVLDNAYEFPFLIVEGLYRGNPNTGTLQVYNKKLRENDPWIDFRFDKSRRVYKYEHIRQFLLTVALHSRVKVLYSSTSYDTASVVSSLYRWFQKDWDQHTAMKQIPEIVIDAPSPVMQFVPPTLPQLWARCLDGVGHEKSLRVASHFKSARRLALAREEEWLKIDGIGKTLARRIVAAISQES